MLTEDRPAEVRDQLGHDALEGDPVQGVRHGVIVRALVDIPSMADVVMVQCWLFGLEMCAGASLEALCELLDAEWPESYRPRALA